jgi:hypothetical protein
MAVPTSYLTGTKNLQEILAAVQKASVPSKFTYDFLKKLGYPSSTDRPLIPLFKAMRFLDASSTPLDRYKRFRDGTQARAVMAEGMREAYADVFGVDQQAQNLSPEDLKGIFMRLSGKSDSVAEKMALTFKSLAGYADFSAPPAVNGGPPPAIVDEPEVPETHDEVERVDRKVPMLQLRHDIHIHLPISTDVTVYDAIFRAVRQNLGD